MSILNDLHSTVALPSRSEGIELSTLYIRIPILLILILHSPHLSPPHHLFLLSLHRVILFFRLFLQKSTVLLCLLPSPQVILKTKKKRGQDGMKSFGDSESGWCRARARCPRTNPKSPQSSRG